ncbi:hypothetical protein VDGL01_11407 [Verticillium dahliae]
MIAVASSHPTHTFNDLPASRRVSPSIGPSFENPVAEPSSVKIPTVRRKEESPVRDFAGKLARRSQATSGAVAAQGNRGEAPPVLRPRRKCDCIGPRCRARSLARRAGEDESPLPSCQAADMPCMLEPQLLQSTPVREKPGGSLSLSALCHASSLLLTTAAVGLPVLYPYRNGWERALFLDGTVREPQPEGRTNGASAADGSPVETAPE